MSKFWYYLKSSIIYTVYLIITMVTACAINLIQGENLKLVKLALYILNMGILVMVCFVTAHKSGQDEYKIRHSNDIQRRVIMRTGDYYEFDLIREYRKNKGFIVGVYVSAFMVILLLAKLILFLFGITESYLDYIFYFLYATFTMPLELFFDKLTVYFAIYGVVIIILVCGLGYEVGARSKQRIYDRINKINEQIHGKKK